MRPIRRNLLLMDTDPYFVFSQTIIGLTSNSVD